MHGNTIHQNSRTSGPAPNLVDYEEARATFSWAGARACLDGLPNGQGLNLAHEAVDRHAAGPRADHVALRFIDRRDATTDITYRELRASTNRFANVLRSLEVGADDTVFLLLNRVPALYDAVFGTCKNRSIVSPLFPAFGPEPIRQRLTLGHGKVLVTSTALYQRKVAPVRDQLPMLQHVVLIDAHEHRPDAWSLDRLRDDASDEFTIPRTDPEDTALLHFTSGTTGTPKGAEHVHDAVVAHHATSSLALDLHADDVFWCTADPGWVTGMSYGVIAPLTHGATNLVDEREFDAERWYRTLQAEEVTVWYTSPTAIRMLMRAGSDLAHQYDLRHLRFLGSVGEPLNPEAVLWTRDALGLPAHDNYWQTETGGIMIANFAACDIKPGSMGRPVPGIDAAIFARDPERDGAVLVRDGHPVRVSSPGTEGHLAFRAGWPSMFRGYLNDEPRFLKCFVDGWYLTGDLASTDDDGYFWFVGRSDDVIKSSGHLIGPFEVESALMEHPAVVEAGVIGVPDPVAGAVVKAFVTLATGYEPSEELRLELVGFARKHLGPAVAPREIAFDQHLPHTRSGKIMRRLLKARELGEPEGDTSTLETAP